MSKFVTESSASISPVSNQNKPARHIPGEPGVWLLIFGDMMVFSLFFVTYLYYRGQDVDLYRQSQTQLNQGIGLLNTCLMLSSSWFVATGVQAARQKLGKVVPLCFVAAFLCGFGFGIAKFFEYGQKLRAGITLTTNDFFMYYFVFTGIHFAHVLIGMAVLGVMVRYTWSGEIDVSRIRHLETGASFWHVVDLLWIVLFALLYLVK